MAVGARRRDGGVYVHVPFCASVCRYCHFARTDRHDAADRERYVDDVLRELDLRLAAGPSLAGGGRRVRSLYVGGGTPSLLAAKAWTRLLDGIRSRLPLRADAEITAEANPESFTDAVADAWRDAGVGRVSLGVQSLDPAVLAWLGRRAGPETARAALRRAAARFPRVAADWILAPGCRAEVLAREFREAREMGVDHVSFYILAWHPGTGLDRDRRRGLVAPEDDDAVAARYLAGRAELLDLGYRHYEVSNFALPGRESRHNAAYWERRPYLGLGPGAHGQWGRTREANHGEIDRWRRDLVAGRLPVARRETLGPARRRLERLVLGLRTAGGVDLADAGLASAVLTDGEHEGLWRRHGDRLVLTARGWLRLDDVEVWLAARMSPAGVS